MRFALMERYIDRSRIRTVGVACLTMSFVQTARSTRRLLTQMDGGVFLTMKSAMTARSIVPLATPAAGVDWPTMSFARLLLNQAILRTATFEPSHYASIGTLYNEDLTLTHVRIK